MDAVSRPGPSEVSNEVRGSWARGASHPWCAGTGGHGMVCREL